MHLSWAFEQAVRVCQLLFVGQRPGLTISLYVICSSSTCVGKQITHDDIIIGLEEVIDARPQEARRFGTAGPYLIYSEMYGRKKDMYLLPKDQVQASRAQRGS
jgi:hypothetical protein